MVTSFIYTEIKPDAQLHDYVRKYWRFERTFMPGETQIIYPDSHYELLWVQRGVLLVDGVPAPKMFLGGCNPRPITLSSPGSVEVWAVRFSPWGLIPFVSPESISDTAQTPAEEKMDAKMYDDLCTLFTGATPNSLHRLLDEYFLGRLVEADKPALLEVVVPFLQRHGAIRIGELAKHMQVSTRHLQRLIREATGNTPRDIRARIRFEYARRAVRTVPYRALTEIALDCGYSDQSHLIKDFQRFTGMSPLQFRELYLTTYAHVLAGKIDH